MKFEGLYLELVYKLKGMKYWLIVENYDYFWYKSRCLFSWGSRFFVIEFLLLVFLLLVIYSEYKWEDFLKWWVNYGFCVYLLFWYNVILYGRIFENIYVIVLIKLVN